jgi:DNA-binding NtrC family response regulator
VRSDWRILVVDDEPVQRESMAVWLSEDGHVVETAASGDEAVAKVREREFAVHFVDLKMPPGMDGIETMREIRRIRPGAAVVIVTAYATVDTAVAAIKEGAVEYVQKPCDPHEISLVVERILKVKALERENLLLRERLEKQFTFHDATSRSPAMHAVFDLIRNVAALRSTVLIEGESGTGKEVIARAIHLAGNRAAKPFVAVPCAALAESLLESELFGHEKGSFTGAVERRKGKFEMADGGTLFLDEIGEIAPKVQVELLRVLQERSFFRVGGSDEIHVDVRVVAATNRNLAQAVREGRFREDLFYRLNVVQVRLPPLRDRLEDVPLLAARFAERISVEIGKRVSGVTDGAVRVLMRHSWPGNVRELENAIERAIIVARGDELDEECFAFLAAPAPSDRLVETAVPDVPLRDLEKLAIEAALGRSRGNVKAAAAALGIDRSTLYDKFKRYDIPRPAAASDEPAADAHVA